MKPSVNYAISLNLASKMTIPFTYEQAEEICEDFEDLVDTELVIKADTPVKCVVDQVCIMPFDEADKAVFMEAYHASGNPLQALSTYGGDEFDVVIIAANIKNEKEVVLQPIEEYIAANGVQYNFPG